MICDNEIKKEEVENIYRIEYMHFSNWTLGYKRRIYVVDFKGNKAIRSLYIGDPLASWARKIDDSRDESIEDYEEGRVLFTDHYTPENYYRLLNRCEIWNWMNLKSQGKVYDGPIMEIAFFTKDSKGNDKICRYVYDGDMIDEIMYFMTCFDEFFNRVWLDNTETVRLNKEMMKRSSRMMAGDYEENEREKIFENAKRSS